VRTIPIKFTANGIVVPALFLAHKKIMKTSTIAFSLLFCALASSASAQSEAEHPSERVKRAVEAAYLQAQAQAAEHKPLPKNDLAPEALRKNKVSDPSRIAEQYKEKGFVKEKPTRDLMIFVSTSMPVKALTMLGEQAKAAGGTLIFRGLRKPLGKPGAMEDMAGAIKPAAETGVGIEIDPEAFGRFNVTSVPTFVLAFKEEGCGGEQCATNASALVGDVTLEYALETWVKKGGAVAKLADQYLAKLNGDSVK
jgi:type-F conjugative transfer system pilin assembly protein TrbC